MSVFWSDGNGGLQIDDWAELWRAIFRVLEYAIRFAEYGACRCGCVERTCEYCAHECTGC